MPKEVNQSQRLVERSSVSLSIIHNRRVRAAPLHKDGRFVTMDMNLLLEQLKERFDANYEGLSIASDPRNGELCVYIASRDALIREEVRDGASIVRVPSDFGNYRVVTYSYT